MALSMRAVSLTISPLAKESGSSRMAMNSMDTTNKRRRKAMKVRSLPLRKVLRRVLR